MGEEQIYRYRGSRKDPRIIGLGNVGSAVARRARALEMKLIGYDPFIRQERAQNLQVEIVPWRESIRRLTSLPCISADTETKEMISAKELAMMKPTARIINAARGGLINEEALANALKEKKITGAAVDVFPQEPAFPVRSSAWIMLSSLLTSAHQLLKLKSLLPVMSQYKL